ncbi:helix-turn-helix domain-containing protein [Halomonas sp. FeN2]|uniref:helix-turn-helix transcriptional regulator n=1 Tax=Halomonas sp. FeN2 TaxID=2832500 RepID=UPI000C673DBD|nr:MULTISPECIES: helix-turn-helix domain-containing protein [unclassified Halomonas]MBF58277.1 DNA-binding protein [Halomonas sp.]UBR50889.1 helix-turn-helix domain-containing protein [Halomonas sp. FeN2]|tara:strand:+ start:10057 stop:10269 length:213 start_codon:yes stop_codon:yes gene_type:complete
MNTTASFPTLLDQKQVATYLGKSVAWCERSRWDGTGPRFIKVGRAVRYRADDVLAWLEANTRTNTSEDLK